MPLFKVPPSTDGVTEIRLKNLGKFRAAKAAWELVLPDPQCLCYLYSTTLSTLCPQWLNIADPRIYATFLTVVLGV